MFRTMWRFLRFLTRLCIGLMMLAVVSIVALELWINAVTANRCHTNPADCRQGDVAVVLGCSQYVRPNVRNAYFTGRISAAAELWKAGKLRCIIVSGDNRERYYNEPRDMKAALVAHGVPADRIVCDYAGLRTYDSVIRANRIFGAEHITFISQREHAERAVTIARRLGLDAEGYAAPLPIKTSKMKIRQYMRERLARIAMLVDLTTAHDPAYLGEKVKLPK